MKLRKIISDNYRRNLQPNGFLTREQKILLLLIIPYYKYYFKKPIIRFKRLLPNNISFMNKPTFTKQYITKSQIYKEYNGNKWIVPINYILPKD
jgi:hypothetical protein